jgi:polar amino acid transport system substrate-binding protein
MLDLFRDTLTEHCLCQPLIDQYMESVMSHLFPRRLLLCLSFILAAHAQHSFAKDLSFVTEPFEPFNYEENGKIVGAMPEVIQAVCERMKITCKIDMYPWRRSLAMAESGQADGVFSFLRTPERERLFYFPDNIARSSYAFFALEKSTFVYKQPKDLDDRTVGVYGPSGTSSSLEEVTKESITSRTEVEINNMVLMKKLINGRYGENGIILINRDVGNVLIKKDGTKGVKVVGELKELNYTVGLSKSSVSEAQFKEFNAALRVLIKEGKIKPILDKYGVSAPK